jgi:hypothetical protein
MSETIALPEKGLILPPGVAQSVAPIDKEYEEAEQKATQLPKAKGWRILCALVTADNEYESGLAKAGMTKKNEELTSPVLFVLQKGPLCYSDLSKFPDGVHWCEEGEFIITRPYTGTRIMIHGKEFRIIYDDQVEATVEDPRGISRV